MTHEQWVDKAHELADQFCKYTSVFKVPFRAESTPTVVLNLREYADALEKLYEEFKLKNE